MYRETNVLRDVTTGDWVEIEEGDKTYKKTEAARRLGCDESDLRWGHDHSGREPEDTEDAEAVLQDALGEDSHGGSYP